MKKNQQPTGKKNSAKELNRKLTETEKFETQRCSSLLIISEMYIKIYIEILFALIRIAKEGLKRVWGRHTPIQC